MQLPRALQQAIEHELAAFDTRQLRAAAAHLSHTYREATEVTGEATRNAAPISNDAQRAAYLAVRLPATFAAVSRALSWTLERVNEDGSQCAAIQSMLDLGSGPGTAIWAATEQLSSLESVTAIERDSRLIEAARRLASGEESALPKRIDWRCADLAQGLPEGQWDLVVCSYALNELSAPQRVVLLRQAWSRTAKLLVIVEPGTQAGFANVASARALLAENGAAIVAPCPHALACPMQASGDWCHFAARVERSALHRRLKEGELGHEDEKFSYAAFARITEDFAPLPAASRIVRHPRLFSGYAKLSLCQAQGQIESATVTRSQKDDWRRLKRLGWGDAW